MTLAITLVPAFDPASMFLILVLLAAVPIIVVAGFALGWWGRNASQDGEFDPDNEAAGTGADGARPQHNRVSSRTLRKTAGRPHELQDGPR